MKRLITLVAFAVLALGNGNTPYPVVAWGSSSLTAGYGGFWGPATVFSGYDTYYSLQLHYAVDITCDHTTNTCTTGSGGYTPTGTETLTLWNVGTLQGVGIVSSGTMPASTQCASGSSMCSVYGGGVAYYHLCNIVGNSFTLAQGSTCAATQQTFTSNGTGQLSMIMDQPTTAYLSSVSGYPAGTAVAYWQALNGGIVGPAATSSGTPFFQYANDVIYVQLSVPATASGAFTLSFTVSTVRTGGGASSTFTFPINVVQISPVATNQDPASYPAIPGLATWRSCMTGTGCNGSPTGGGAYWRAHSFPMGGCDGTRCYYDGIRSDTNIAAYTGDSSWITDAQSIARFYSIGTSGVVNTNGTTVTLVSGDQFANTSSGQITINSVNYTIASWTDATHLTLTSSAGTQTGVAYSFPFLSTLGLSGSQSGYTVFPDGLAMAAAASGDTRNLTALASFVVSLPGQPNGGGGYVKFGGLVDPTYVRETAYALKVYNVLELAGYPRVYWVGGAFPQFGAPSSGTSVDLAERTTTMLLEILSEDVDGINARLFAKQPFMDGLAMEALIQRWQITHDPRIPYVVKREIDDLKANWYDSTNHTLFYNTGSDGPGCSLNSYWFGSANSSLCGTGPAGTSATAVVLNNLYSPAWAWYWRVCGGCGTYQADGDDLFQHSFDNATSSGKEFSQLYRWSFDYVRWRSGH